ncbi:MAG: ATP-dependent DNA helicase RecG [Gammaproteobacteria bacterium]|nr:ATP-dependent DNA helicase RecG [Gammaproteobacteria bacterium]
MTLDSAATYLKGAGPFVAQRLRQLGIERVGELLLHLPTRYQDRRRTTPLSALNPGGEALIVAQVTGCELGYSPRRNLRVLVEADNRALLLRFFHFSEWQQRGFVAGLWVRAWGTVRHGAYGAEMIHPEYRLSESPDQLADGESWQPVYPTVAGLTQVRLRLLIGHALAVAADDPRLSEVLPGLGGPPTPAALRALHQPAAETEAAELLHPANPARLRLIREELLAHQLCMRLVRSRTRLQHAAHLPGVEQAAAVLQEHLPFVLTGAQRRVIGEIAGDLTSGRPMLRLVQGDVGCGKTLVAASAMLAAARAGRQALMMAPTELLAEQHARNLSRWLEPLNVTVGLLSGRLKAAARNAALAAAASGRIKIWVGTHALFQQQVAFQDLTLMVIDEQHRFGVAQRLALHEKARDGLAHQLIMSATPIPRTLAQTLYADLDVSVIDELPPGRRPVVTVALSNQRRSEVLERIGAACRTGRQAYWVCTLIEESEQLQAQAAEAAFRQLREELPELRVGLLHGRMKPAGKDVQMSAFAAGTTQLLVATTVIEVGVDVPNASIMVIENAERLGLAQLHQLRGRVGRGDRDSQCVLLYQLPLSAVARARLEVMRQTHDGFAIARRDLELRGPGELLGRRQTGLIGLKVADPLRDSPLIPSLQRLADDWLTHHPATARTLIRRWIGDAARYGQV